MEGHHRDRLQVHADHVMKIILKSVVMWRRAPGFDGGLRRLPSALWVLRSGEGGMEAGLGMLRWWVAV